MTARKVEYRAFVPDPWGARIAFDAAGPKTHQHHAAAYVLLASPKTALPSVGGEDGIFYPLEG